MKNLLILIMSVCTICAFGQESGQKNESGSKFLTGFNALIQYENNAFGIGIEPVIGSEINKVFAFGVGFGGGYSGVIDEGFFIVEPFFRLTAVGNEFVFLDFKPTFGWCKYVEDYGFFQGGISPSVRFRLNKHMDLAADFGMFGVRKYHGEEVNGLIGLGSGSIWLTFRF